MVIEAGKTYYDISDISKNVYVNRIEPLDNGEVIVRYTQIDPRELNQDGWCAGRLEGDEKIITIGGFLENYTDFEGLRDMKLSDLGIE